MPANNQNDDLFSASLESISTSKRIDKFQRFKTDFQRECTVTLNNAQEWIKAELPIVTDYIDPVLIKDELKQSKTSDRRKYLLSALLFEKSLKESIDKNDATKAAVMAMHMVNHMWLAKVELHGLQPIDTTAIKTQHSAIDTHSGARNKILTSIIEKAEKLKRESQIQEKSSSTTSEIGKSPKKQNKASTPGDKKTYAQAHKKELKKTKKKKIASVSKKNQIKSKTKKKAESVLSKVKTKLPLKKISDRLSNKEHEKQVNANESVNDEDLFDDPNQSSIMVNTGFSDSIDDSIIKAREEIFKDPNDTGVKMHKILKDRDHQRQNPGSNTIIMKLASSSGKKPGAKLSIPEQCQIAINQLTDQFPGYDMVAIRNMAAEKVGVSPQYIENLNILPEKTG